MKKLLYVFVCLVVIGLCVPALCSADDSGTCGTNASWTFRSVDGVLTISGSGAMENYYSSAPWHSYDIKEIVISNGITNIGGYAFSGCINLTSITIPDSITSIGDGAFSVCTNLTSITIPDSVTIIDKYAFYGCNSLTDVYYEDNEQQWVQISIGYKNTQLTSANIHFNCHDHEWSEPVYTWSDDNLTVTATRTCTKYAIHEETETVAVSIDAPNQPTCTQEGNAIYTSVPFNNSAFSIQTKVIALEALGHDSVTDEAVAPTCTETGLTEGAHCTRCGAILTAQQTIPALGHDAVTDVAVAPTCTETGLTEGAHCSVCGETLTAQETVPALGHIWIEPTYQWSDDNSTVTASCVCERDNEHTYTETVQTTSTVAKAPTCEAMGDTTYTSAAFENGVFAVQTKTVTDIPATGHNWNAPVYVWSEDMTSVTATRICRNDQTHVETESVAATSEVWLYPTCESMGKTRYTSAAFVNPAFAVQRKTLTNIDALGHDWGKAIYTWSDDMTTVTATRTCRNDTEHNHVETETVTVTAVVTIPATCETKGWTKYSSAVFENEEFVAQVRTLKNIPALGHDWSEPEYIWAEDNSAVTASRVCGNDHSHIETETVDVTAEVTLPATCEEMGQTTYTSLAFVNDDFAVQSKTLTDIAALGHTVVVDEAVEATCTATGLTEGSHCGVCGKVITLQETIPMASHNWAIIDAVPATCEEPGLTSHVECTVCGRILIAGTAIPATGHEWGEPSYKWADDRHTVTATRICVHDVSHTDSETVAAYGKVVLSPTQTETGTFRWVSAVFDNTAFTAQETDGGTIPALNEMNVLYLPDALDRIEAEAFYGIPAEAIIIPDGCTEIAPGAFVNCKNLKYVRIPAGITVPEDAFVGCPNVVIDQW